MDFSTGTQSICLFCFIIFSLSWWRHSSSIRLHQKLLCWPPVLMHAYLLLSTYCMYSPFFTKTITRTAQKRIGAGVNIGFGVRCSEMKRVVWRSPVIFSDWSPGWRADWNQWFSLQTVRSRLSRSCVSCLVADPNNTGMEDGTSSSRGRLYFLSWLPSCGKRQTEKVRERAKHRGAILLAIYLTGWNILNRSRIPSWWKLYLSGPIGLWFTLCQKAVEMVSGHHSPFLSEPFLEFHLE